MASESSPPNKFTSSYLRLLPTRDERSVHQTLPTASLPTHASSIQAFLGPSLLFRLLLLSRLLLRLLFRLRYRLLFRVGFRHLVQGGARWISMGWGCS